MIIRSKHDKRNPYLTISMKILRDRRLSSEERDCLIMMLSNSDNWEFSYTGLASQLGIRRETVKTRVQSLIEKGYVSVSYPTGENGKPLPFAKGVWEIREEPIRAGFTDTRKPAHTCLISRHEDSVTSEQALASRHEDLGARDPAQRTTEGIKSGLSNAKHQEKDDQGENHHPLQEAQAQEEEVDVSFQSIINASPWESSSEAKASPLSSKTPTEQAEVIDQTEYLYQQLRNKYPPHRLGNYADGLKTFRSIPDIVTVYPEIEQGLKSWKQSESWSNEDGRYVPGLVKFLIDRKWKIPPTWNNDAETNSYANSEARKEAHKRWQQIETRMRAKNNGGD